MRLSAVNKTCGSSQLKPAGSCRKLSLVGPGCSRWHIVKAFMGSYQDSSLNSNGRREGGHFGMLTRLYAFWNKMPLPQANVSCARINETAEAIGNMQKWNFISTEIKRQSLLKWSEIMKFRPGGQCHHQYLRARSESATVIFIAEAYVSVYNIEMTDK